MYNKIYKILLIAAVLILTFIASFSLVTEDVPVLNKNVEADSEITIRDVKEIRVFKWTLFEDECMDYSDIVGKVANADLSADTPLFKAAFREKVAATPDVSDEETVIVPIPVKSDNVPSTLKEGDLVNLIIGYAKETLTNSGMESDPFVIGFDEILTVSKVTRDESSKITKIDVVTTKDQSTEIVSAIALKGDVYVITNDQYNDVHLKGIMIKDLYLKYYTQAIEEPSVEVTE